MWRVLCLLLMLASAGWRDAVAAVLHHRELPPALAQAVQAAGVRTIVLQTEGRDPLGELRENSQRLSALAMGR